MKYYENSGTIGSVCNLGAINLAEHVNKETKEFDFEQLAQTMRTAVRLQDNVVDASPYFFEQNETQAYGERRLGIGVMGLGDALIYAEKRYGSKEGNDLVNEIFKTMALTGWRESIEIAKEKGSFKFLQGKTEEETMQLRQNFIETGYIQTLPQELKDDILEHGIRNAAILTVAPTGSTGTMMNVSTGLEPYFAFKYFRSGRLGKFIEVNADIVQEYLDANPDADADNLPDFFASTMDLSPEAHVDVQTTIQRWVDSSISKTVNMPAGSTRAEVAKVYEMLYEGGAKGGTVFVDGSRDTQVLTLSDEFDDTSKTGSLEEEDPFPGLKDIKVSTIDATLIEASTPESRKEKEIKDHLATLDIGIEAGNLCPVCQKGEVILSGGCTECINCGTQLRCE